MQNPLLLKQSRANDGRDSEVSSLDQRDAEESGSFRSLEEIVNRVYPQPRES